MISEQDFQLKLKCLELVANEDLSKKGFIKIREVLKRAKEFYQESLIAGIDKWEFKMKPEIPKENIELRPTVTPELDFNKEMKIKECSKCHETVPIAFKIHKYTSKGEPCGHVF